MTDTSTDAHARFGLTRRRVTILAVLALLVLAFVVGTRNPHTSETTAFCVTRPMSRSAVTPTTTSRTSWCTMTGSG